MPRPLGGVVYWRRRIIAILRIKILLASSQFYSLLSSRLTNRRNVVGSGLHQPGSTFLLIQYKHLLYLSKEPFALRAVIG